MEIERSNDNMGSKKREEKSLNYHVSYESSYIQNEELNSFMSERTILGTIEIPCGYRYNEKAGTLFGASIDSHNLDIVIETKQVKCNKRYKVYLSGQIVSNINVGSFHPVENCSDCDDVKFNDVRVVTFNELLGTLDTMEEVEEILNSGIEIIAGQISAIAVFPDDREIEYWPKDEAFFDSINGIQNTIIVYRYTVMIRVSPAPFS